MNERPNVADWLLAPGRADAPALLASHQVVTYAELRRQVRRLSAALRADGAAPGERVGLWAQNSIFFVVSYLATLHAGLCCVPFPAGTDAATLRRLARFTGLRRLLVQAKWDDLAAEWTQDSGLDLWAEPSLEQRCRGVGEADAAPVDPSRDVAAIVVTSGSTGQPKGVMISHANIAANTSDICSFLRLDESSRCLVVLPLSYCYGASLLHTHLRAGGSLGLVGSFMFTEKVLDELAATECTSFAGVPSTYQILLRRTSFGRREFPCLRQLQQAGGKLADPFLLELRRAQPRAELFVMYGQTEATARLSYLPPELLEAKLGSIGRGLPSTQLAVLHEDGTPVRPGTEEVGQIVATGPNVALGYWEDPEETARFFRDGSLWTGDLARVDEDGFIYIVDRAREFIKSMGHRVSPREVEEVICELPQVIEVGVVGKPSDFLGEALCAFLVCSPPAPTEEEVRAHCNGRLPNWKLPQEVVFVPRLPKNSSEKLDRPRLRDWAANGARP